MRTGGTAARGRSSTAGATRIPRSWILAFTVAIAAGWLLIRPQHAKEPSGAAPSDLARTAAAEDPIEVPPRSTEREVGAVQSARADGDADVSATPEVVLSTRKAMLPNAEFVPGIAVALGLGAPLDPSCAPFAEVVTDEHGIARVTIPAAALRAARAKPGDRVWARVVSPGYQQRTHSRPLSGGCEPIEMTIVPWPGGTLRGRLLDAEGRPTPGNVRAATRMPTGALGLGASADAGTDGWFEILLSREGTYQLVADARDSGTGVVRDCAVRFTDAAPVEIRTTGPGTIRGRIHDSAGRGSSGLEILVLVSALDDERGSFVLPEPQETEAQLEGRGRLWSTVQTRADGSFEVLGLRSDRYVIRAKRNRSERFGPYPELLTPVAVESDGSALDLAFDRPHLAVRIENTDHSPWGGKLHLDTRPYPEPPEEWPADVSLLVFPARAEAHLDERDSSCLRGRPVEGGETVFEVTAGRHYEIGLAGGSQGWHPVGAYVPPESSRVEVVLTASAEVPRGSLVVSAFDQSGAMVTNGLVLRIEDPDLGVPLVERRSHYGATWPQRIQLAEGDYRLVVEGIGTTEFEHGVLMAPRAHGRFDTPVRIERDRETDVRADLAPGARVHLHLLGEVLDQDREAIRERYEGWHLPGGTDNWAERPSIVLVSGDRWPEPVEFTVEMRGSSAAGTHLTSKLALGTDAVSQMLPTGRYSIQARMPGGRVASQDLDLVEGQTSEVTLTFQ
jgi:hypothetical protein